jgi:Family of unknown function (DUF6498)
MKLKRQLTQSDIFLIVANLIPVIGVWFWDWSPASVFIVYCFETIIVGFFNLVKLGIATAIRKTDTWYNGSSQTTVSGLLFMFFFVAHYGLFVTIQMSLFFGISGLADQYNLSFFNFFYKWPQLITSDTLIMLSVFVASYGFRVIKDFIISGDYKTMPMGLIMFQPYLRIFIQQVTVIAGSFFLQFGAGKIFILIFAMVKVAFEVYVNYDSLLAKAATDLKSKSGEK